MWIQQRFVARDTIFVAPLISKARRYPIFFFAYGTQKALPTHWAALFLLFLHHHHHHHHHRAYFWRPISVELKALTKCTEDKGGGGLSNILSEVRACNYSVWVILYKHSMVTQQQLHARHIMYNLRGLARGIYTLYDLGCIHIYIPEKCTRTI